MRKPSLGLVGLFAFAIAGCSGSDVETPKLSIETKTPPGPGATELHLVAGDVEACSEGDTEVVDLSVDQGLSEVVIDASLQTTSPAFTCEIRTVRDSFEVALDRPLGQRLVIDDSRGERTVIWSPSMRQEVGRTRRVTQAEANRFVRSEYPGTHKQMCVRSGIDLFLCTTRYPGKSRIFLHVVVLPSGELKARPG